MYQSMTQAKNVATPGGGELNQNEMDKMVALGMSDSVFSEGETSRHNNCKTTNEAATNSIDSLPAPTLWQKASKRYRPIVLDNKITDQLLRFSKMWDVKSKSKEDIIVPGAASL